MNSPSTFELKITIDEETNELIKELRGLSKNQELNTLIKEALKTQIELKKKKKFALTKTINQSTPAVGAGVNRTPTRPQKREVYNRNKTCQKCGTIHHLNFDHIKAYALGGSTTLSNLRQLCSNCNQRLRIKMKLRLKSKKYET